MSDKRTGRGVADKGAVFRGQLRAKFMQRDRLVREIAVLDGDISQLVRILSTAQGLITPMRVEQARQLVLGAAMQPVVEEEDAI